MPDLEKRPCANTNVIPDSTRILITTHGEEGVHRITDRSLTEETLTTGKAARHDLPEVLNLGIPGKRHQRAPPATGHLCGSLNLMERKPDQSRAWPFYKTAGCTACQCVTAAKDEKVGGRL